MIVDILQIKVYNYLTSESDTKSLRLKPQDLMIDVT